MIKFLYEISSIKDNKEHDFNQIIEIIKFKSQHCEVLWSYLEDVTKKYRANFQQKDIYQNQ